MRKMAVETGPATRVWLEDDMEHVDAFIGERAEAPEVHQLLAITHQDRKAGVKIGGGILWVGDGGG